MNIQQLEYIVALDKHRHFARAAESCKVSQPTLSALIQKLEEELDLTIFDRTHHPVRPTEAGTRIIEKARQILHSVSQLKEMALNERGMTSGMIRLGIIPTVAPYVLPGLFRKIAEKYPQIELRVSEMRTAVIIEKLRKGEIDMALLATPLEIDDFLEIPVYYEKFVAYVSPEEKDIYDKTELDAKTMITDKLWVLQEGHCMRNQVFNFCLSKSQYTTIYEAGSIDTLIKIVDSNGGYTVIPELHAPLLTEAQRENLRPLISPAPVREISILVRKDYVRERLLNCLISTIKGIIPEEMLNQRVKKFAVRL
ncbi:MAG: LysR family transcriptional regulator [Bacteroidaceae bacterium]|nr:LysR family transcriptional regulator [Bacteroidaceae bacterium]